MNKSNVKLAEFTFDDTLEGERQNIWFNVSVLKRFCFKGFTVFFRFYPIFLNFHRFKICKMSNFR